jgi:hypothetical protein
MQQDVQLVCLGTGSPELEDGLRWLEFTYKWVAGLVVGVDYVSGLGSMGCVQGCVVAQQQRCCCAGSDAGAVCDCGHIMCVQSPYAPPS